MEWQEDLDVVDCQKYETRVNQCDENSICDNFVAGHQVNYQDNKGKPSDAVQKSAVLGVTILKSA